MCGHEVKGDRAKSETTVLVVIPADRAVCTDSVTRSHPENPSSTFSGRSRNNSKSQ